MLEPVIIQTIHIIHLRPLSLLRPTLSSFAVQAVLFADVFANPLIRVLDLYGLVKRYVAAPMAGTEDRAKELNEGTEWSLSERYAESQRAYASLTLTLTEIIPDGIAGTLISSKVCLCQCTYAICLPPVFLVCV